MADPSPDDRHDGQEPDDDASQVLDPEDESGDDDGQKPTGRTYSESYVRALRREAADHRTRLAEVEKRLQERDDADKTEGQKLSEKLTDAETRAAQAESRLVRFEVAAERGLDMQAAKFLVGSTRDEVEASAEDLAKLLKEKGKTTPSFDGGARQPAPEQRSPEQAHNDLLLGALGRQAS